MKVNRTGYLVRLNVSEDDASGWRTYACTDRNAVNDLLELKFGRSPDTFPQDARGLPTSPALHVTYPFHIYGQGDPVFGIWEDFIVVESGGMPESEYETEVTGATPHTGR